MKSRNLELVTYVKDSKERNLRKLGEIGKVENRNIVVPLYVIIEHSLVIKGIYLVKKKFK